MSTYGGVGPDVHTLIKELAIRRVEHRSAIHSNEAQHLAEGTEVARLQVLMSSAAILFCFTAGTFSAHASRLLFVLYGECVFSSHLFWTSSSLDVLVGVT